MYLLIIFAFGWGSDAERLKYLGYDWACGLHPFMQKLPQMYVTFAKYFLKRVHFLVDRFHVSKRTEKCWMPVANNPLCKYNPDLPEFKEVSGVNSECAEQAIHWLNKLKFSIRQMSNTGTIFLYKLIKIHTTYVSWSLSPLESYKLFYVKTLLLRRQQEIATTPDSILWSFDIDVHICEMKLFWCTV